MASVYPALPIAIALAIFALLARHALEMRTRQNYREMWGALTLSLLPSAVFCFIVATGESSMLARNFLLIPAGAVIGACIFAYGGHVIADLRAAPAKNQPLRPSPHYLDTITVQNAPSINTWNQSGGNNTIVVGPAKLTFDPTIAVALADKLPSGKPIILQSVGSQGDQAIADQYQIYLKERGFVIAERNMIGTLIPPPDHKISILDTGQKVVVTIAPSAQ